MLGKPQFEALSEFRFRLAQFLHFSESAARAEGVTPAQYLLLLHLHGFHGRSWGTVGELAERLQASHQATVALVQRCERNGLVAKRRSRSDAVASAIFSASLILPLHSTRSLTDGPSAIMLGTPRGASV